MKKLLSIVVALGALCMAATAFAADAPDLVGTWKGETNAVVMGNLAHWNDPAEEKWKDVAEPVFRTHDKVTIVIERQEGSRFSGKRISPRVTEPLIGFVDPDGKTLHMVDEDGYLTGTLNDDGTLYVRYLNTGTSMIASYTTYAKVK